MRIPCSSCGKSHNVPAMARWCKAVMARRAKRVTRAAKRRRSIVKRELRDFRCAPSFGGVARETLAEHVRRTRRQDAIGGTHE
jgi:hypothetical protein